MTKFVSYRDSYFLMDLISEHPQVLIETRATILPYFIHLLDCEGHSFFEARQCHLPDDGFPPVLARKVVNVLFDLAEPQVQVTVYFLKI